MKKYLLIILFLSMWLQAEEKSIERYIVYYSDQAHPKAFDPFDVLILDSDVHPNLLSFREKKKTLIGYLSVGEVENYRAYFQQVKDEGILLEENENWKGSFFVDVRDPRWFKRVVEDLIPRILHKGFRGIFLDTVDNPIYLEDKDPETFKGMKQGMIDLIKGIRMHYPEIILVMNRGFEILPDVANDIDVMFGESTYTTYNFEKKRAELTKEDEYLWYLSVLKEGQKLNPKLKVYTLDYWDLNDVEMVKKIYRLQRSHGFIPYVSTVKLNQVVYEPK